ncbi:MAG: NAD(P)-binding protein, partial [archaeon]|nr:NAD(P)-binding protein [archaeon]
MNKKILIAGGGHGGLIAAKFLADKGYKVKVIEKKLRNDLGYPWHDDFNPHVFNDIGIDGLREDQFILKEDIMFISPDLHTELITQYSDEDREIGVDRKILLDHLISIAEKAGV